MNVLLLTMIPQQRVRTLREPRPDYQTNATDTETEWPPVSQSLPTLLKDIPMP
jgi:hypothetical protein